MDSKTSKNRQVGSIRKCNCGDKYCDAIARFLQHVKLPQRKPKHNTRHSSGYNKIHYPLVDQWNSNGALRTKRKTNIVSLRMSCHKAIQVTFIYFQYGL